MKLVFQSTLPRGSDQLVIIFSVRLRWNFNPRSLAGATVWYSIYKHNKAISIHAPSRERPGDGYSALKFGSISIHAPSRERPISRCNPSYTSDFNPRSLAGATLHSLQCRSIKKDYFNPRSLAGATRNTSLYSFHLEYFNPRSLAGATITLFIS